MKLVQLRSYYIKTDVRYEKMVVQKQVNMYYE